MIPLQFSRFYSCAENAWIMRSLQPDEVSARR